MLEQNILTGIFDSHAHYDDEKFSADQSQVIEEILPAGGVCAVMNVGCDLKSSYTSFALAQKYDFFYAAAGIHPHDAVSLDDQALSEIAQLCRQDKVCALGEIGLDFHYNFSPREVQKTAFERQLQLAKQLDMPVIIHSREACEPTLQLLRKYRPKGVVHCFSGSAETAKEIVSLGMYVGFTGVVTFKNARRAIEAAQVVPLHRLLVETDAPYMAPHPYRGKRCDSTMIAQTARVLAEIKGVDAQELLDITRQNAYDVYEIK